MPQINFYVLKIPKRDEKHLSTNWKWNQWYEISIHPKITGQRSKNAENNVHEVAITGVHGYATNASVNSRMSRPVDLTESVEEAKVCYVDENLTSFEDKVLKLVKKEKKVLIIVVSDEELIFDLVISKIAPDDVIVHTAWNEVNEEETIDWIDDRSDKKYLITDHLTVTGFEFDTVIIVADEELRHEISNVCQRAKSKLILCCFSESVWNNISNHVDYYHCSVEYFINLFQG